MAARLYPSDLIHHRRSAWGSAQDLSGVWLLQDPNGTFTKAPHGRLLFKRRPGWEIGEHTCVAREDANYLEFKSRTWNPK